MFKQKNETRGIVAYFLICFGVAWLDWLLAWIIAKSATTFTFTLLALPAAFAPALATIVVRRWITREGFADAGLRPHLKEKWRYYLIAFFWSVPVMAIGVLLDVIFGHVKPDFSLQRGLALLQPGLHVPTPIIWLLHVVVPLVNTFVVWGEEFGWQGYLLLRMRELFRERPLFGVLLTGMIWGLWHIPLHLMGYFHDLNVLLDTTVYVATLILLFIVLSWLRFTTNSVWASSLAHAANNSFLGSFSLFLLLGGGTFPYGGILGLIPLGAFCCWIIFSGRLKPVLTMPSYEDRTGKAANSRETDLASPHDQHGESSSLRVPRV